MSIRSLVCACIGALAVAALLLLTPRQTLEPKGVVLPTTKKTFAAVSPDKVVIYHQVPSQDYQEIAQIRAELGFKSPTSKATQAKLMRYVKKLAGSAGANGVIVRWLVPDEGVQKAFTFVGQAIRLSASSVAVQGASYDN